MSDVCYSELIRQASRRLSGRERVASRNDDPGYYNRRIMVARHLMEPLDAVSELEALGKPLGRLDRLEMAVGPRLAAALRLASQVPLCIDTVDGMERHFLVSSEYIMAIDADDEAEAAAGRSARHEVVAPPAVAACPVPPKTLSFEEAAAYLGVSVATIRHLVKTRKLAYVQVGDQRGRVIKIADLDDFIEAQRQPTGAELRAKKPRRRSP